MGGIFHHLPPLPDAAMRAGIVKLIAEQKNAFHSADVSSSSEALKSHLG
jgi:hypothetical protein